MTDQRSGCPINLTLETLGDRWSLIVIRDVMFGNRRHFRVLLNESDERIASNILADRLKRLVASGLLSKVDDPTHKQKAIYSLTEPAIQLVPLLAHMAAWGSRHLPVTRELSVRSELLEAGGPALWNDFMDELRTVHLGAPAKPGASVSARLQAAYEAAVTGKIGLRDIDHFPANVDDDVGGDHLSVGADRGSIAPPPSRRRT
jgi:DNA-binding HxlR family transcriptional regulator